MRHLGLHTLLPGICPDVAVLLDTTSFTGQTDLEMPLRPPASL